MRKQEKSLAFNEVAGSIRRNFSVSTSQDQPKISQECVGQVSERAQSSNSLYLYLASLLQTTFLPDNYPHCVTPDYLPHQMYSAAQNLSSSVTGTLSTRAILSGVGVGESTATLVSSTLSWLLRDGTGMIGRIFVAGWIGSDFGHDAKRWRLIADITNDIGLMLEIFSSHLPKSYFLTLVLIASIFKAICAVAGGATRASLTEHFGRGANAADVSAKTGSLETMVGLVGMFLGFFVAWIVPNTVFHTSVVCIIFVFLHVYFNYWGVKILVLSSINPQRAQISLNSFLEKKTVPTPTEMLKLESVFPTLAMRHSSGGVTLGASFLKCLQKAKDFVLVPLRGEIFELAAEMQEQMEAQRFVAVSFPKSKYRGPFSIHGQAPQHVWVMLAEDCNDEDVLKAYILSLQALHHHVGQCCVLNPDPSFEHLYQGYKKALQAAGWNLQRVSVRSEAWRFQNKGKKQ